MILDKFKNAKFRDRYSFNFLALCGLLLMLTFGIHIFPNFFDYCILPACLLTVFIAILAIFICVISSVVCIFENKFNKRIKNERYLNSNFIFYLQVLGIFSIIFFVILFFLILYLVIMNVVFA